MSRRIGFVGHHGSTDLFLAVFERLRTFADIHPDPAMITFNRYWADRVRERHPKAVIATFPNRLDWIRRRIVNGRSAMADPEGFERAWKLDKVIRRVPRQKADALWGLTVEVCERFLDEGKPDLLYTELLQTMPCFALHRACERRGIPFVQLVSSRIQGRFDYFFGESGTPHGLERMTEPSDAALRQADDVVRQVLDKAYRGPAYIQSYIAGRRIFKPSDVRKGLNHLIEQWKGGWLEPTSPGIWHPILSKFKGRGVARRFANRAHYKSVDDVRSLPGRKALFALHVTPESSTDLWAPAFNDMVATVRNIMENLPPGWTLVMKEHPSAVFLQRSREESEALRAVPRSVLVSPFESNDALLAACEALIVINSTLGWEAIIKGYPVVSIAHPFYDLSGQTLVCDPITTLPTVLRRAESFRPNLQEFKRFVAAYIDASDPGAPDNPSMYPYALEPRNVDDIAQGLSRRFLAARRP